MDENDLIREVVKRKRKRSLAVDDKDGEENSKEEILFRLVSLDSSNTVYNFGSNGTRIGRDPCCCDIVFSDSNISRIHCVLSVLESEICAYDKSFNGTFINGSKIGRGRFSLIFDGDVISVANPVVSEAPKFSFTFQNLRKEEGKMNDNLAEELRFYKLGPSIGQGSFSNVKIGVHRITGEQVAVKIVEKNKQKLFQMQGTSPSIRMEVEISRRIHHPHIVRTFDTIDTEEFTAIVMEYVNGGDLFDYIVGRGKNPFSEDEAKFLFAQIVEAFYYLKRNRIVHCDVKPENLLVKITSPQDGESVAVQVSPSDALVTAADNHQDVAKALSPFNVCIMLTDFGCARYDGDEISFGDDNVVQLGTPSYAAPELLEGIDSSTGEEKGEGLKPLKLSAAIDVWSLGVLLYVMCTGSLPKRPRTSEDVFSVGKSFLFSDSCRDLLTRMICVDAALRIPIEDIVTHEWLRDCNFNLDIREEDSLSATMPSSPHKSTRASLTVGSPLTKSIE